MGLLRRLKLLILFVRLVRDPTRTDLIIQGVSALTKSPDENARRALFELEQYVMKQDDFVRLYKQNYNPQASDLKMLSLMPRESFGYAVYKHMNDNNLNFEVFPYQKSENFIDYLTTRIYQDHDLWHVLLGRGIELEDELAIQAFGVAQFRSMVGLLIIVGGILNLMGKNPSKAVDAFQGIHDSYSLGKQIPFLLSVKLHEMFEMPLDKVRAQCGIQKTKEFMISRNEISFS